MGVEKQQQGTVEASASEIQIPDPSSEELIPMSELAKMAGVPLSTANKYVRRHPEVFHPVQSSRGNRFPRTDMQILKDLYESSPRKNQEPPQRLSAGKKGTVPAYQKTGTRTLPVESLTDVEVEALTETETQGDGLHEPTSDTKDRPSPEFPQSISDAVAASLSVDVERLFQMEQQILAVLGNIDQRYRFMFDQFDQLNRIIARSWETQQMFAQTIHQTLERFKQQDKIIDMLMDHSKKLEKDNSRLMELFSAVEQVAATLQPAERHTQTVEERNPQGSFSSALSPAMSPAPTSEESRGFLRRRRRRRQR